MIAVELDAGVAIPASEMASLSAMVRAVSSVIEREESVAFDDVTILLVSDERICELHDRYFADPSPTDIITFPGDAKPQHGRLSGDIAICYDVAAEQAIDAGQSVLDELVFLAAHGLLHLCGWDDEAPDDRQRMLERQSEIIELARRRDESAT